MAEPAHGVMTDEVFTTLAQIFGAFAQGAAGVFVDPGVILAAREDYRGPVERDREFWPTRGPLILALTRVIGQLAAHKALAEGQITITVAHYRAAQHDVHRVGICPFHLG